MTDKYDHEVPHHDPREGFDASEPAALAYGLRFIPLTEERFDLVVPAVQAGSREVQALLRALTSQWLLDQLTSLPGYSLSNCGERIATLPPAG